MGNESTYELICAHFQKIANEAASRGSGSDDGPTRLLIVDDDENFIAQAKGYLPRRGVDVDGATRGSEALRMFSAAKKSGNPYRLVLLDLKMPGESPVEILRELNALDRQPPLANRTPITICTMFPSAEEVHDCIRIGYVGLLHKPVDFEMLLHVLQYHNIR